MVYDQLNVLTNNMEVDTNVVFNNTNWVVSYRFNNDKEFGKNPWNEEITFRYRSPFFTMILDNAGNKIGANEGKTGFRGIQVASYLVNNNWSNVLFNGSVTFVPNSEKLYISPSSTCLSQDKLDPATFGTAMKIGFTAYRDGEVKLYDKTGEFSGVGVNAAPWWGNETENAWVDIKIYHNDTLIWPLEGDAVISKDNTRIAFPDLDAISVEAGDEVYIVFSNNPARPDARSGVICAPAIAYLSN